MKINFEAFFVHYFASKKKKIFLNFVNFESIKG